MSKQTNETPQIRTAPTRHLSAQELKTVTGGLGQRGDDLRGARAVSEDVNGQGGSDVIIGSTGVVG